VFTPRDLDGQGDGRRGLRLPFVGAAVFFIAHMFLGTGLDYLGRLYVNLGNPGT